ncbi:transposase family protein [Streptomyces sp. RB17]|uniref:transposase family protein n=1 Tax=Streptomyces sp. RB17 TaxID=2585197 RepID=UPI001E6118EA|nr:transposase family protein [Streptomyces sp. RB17]
MTAGVPAWPCPEAIDAPPRCRTRGRLGPARRQARHLVITRYRNPDAAPTSPDELPSLLTCLAPCAVLAGAKSLAAIAKWVTDAPPCILARLGGPCREPDRSPVTPAEATVRRALQRIDGDALDTAIGSSETTTSTAATPTTQPTAGTSTMTAATVSGAMRSSRPGTSKPPVLDLDGRPSPYPTRCSMNHRPGSAPTDSAEPNCRARGGP